MGLGIFIAQTLLERSGARLAFDNLTDGGAHVAISWNRANLETVEATRPPAAAMPARRERAVSLGWRPKALTDRGANAMSESERPNRAGFAEGYRPRCAACPNPSARC